MATMQDHIDLVLATIQGLLEQIADLSKRAVAIEDGIAEAQQAYNEKLGLLNSKADELRKREAYLRYELKPKEPIEPKATDPERVNQQEGTAQQTEPARETIAETSLQKDPRDQRKRDLADYILDLIGDEQQVVMERVNAMVADRGRDVGDILEILPWGPIWRLRTDGETLEEQLERLNGWQSALEGRLAFWQGAVFRLESDDSYDLWQEMQTRSPEGWLIYLGELARSQEAENARSEHVVAMLEKELQARKGRVLDG